jgi:hypothetical protein
MNGGARMSKLIRPSIDAIDGITELGLIALATIVDDLTKRVKEGSNTKDDTKLLLSIMQLLPNIKKAELAAAQIEDEFERRLTTDQAFTILSEITETHGLKLPLPRKQLKAGSTDGMGLFDP